MDSNQWFNNDSLKNIDIKKVMLLQELLNQSKGKKTSEMLPFLMAASKQANSKGLSFTKDEIQLIINVLKNDMTPSELERTNKLLSILNL